LKPFPFPILFFYFQSIERKKKKIDVIFLFSFGTENVVSIVGAWQGHEGGHERPQGRDLFARLERKKFDYWFWRQDRCLLGHWHWYLITHPLCFSSSFLFIVGFYFGLSLKYFLNFKDL
jgi:hypothetical protein